MDGGKKGKVKETMTSWGVKERDGDKERGDKESKESDGERRKE